ncbi:epoxide hydrolase 1, partial [Trichonephila clavata]
VEQDTSVHPFKIDVPEEVLIDLKYRLEKTRLEEPVEDSKFLYGFNPNYLRTVLKYWKNEYDWRKQEAELNRLPHFKTRIEGINVHFMHVKPFLPEERTLKVVPLMIIHGWPGSFVEFCKIVPLLVTPRPEHNFVFEVLCPSIPGYGFSESPHRKECEIYMLTCMSLYHGHGSCLKVLPYLCSHLSYDQIFLSLQYEANRYIGKKWLLPPSIYKARYTW